MNEQEKPVSERTAEELRVWFLRRAALSEGSRDRCIDSEWGMLFMAFPDDMPEEEIDAYVTELEAWRDRGQS